MWKMWVNNRAFLFSVLGYFKGERQHHQRDRRQVEQP